MLSSMFVSLDINRESSKLLEQEVIKIKENKQINLLMLELFYKKRINATKTAKEYSE